MTLLSRSALVVALVMTACRSGDAPAGHVGADGDRALAAAASEIEHPEVTTSDSAGVRILTMSRVPPADDPDWEWGLRVTRSIPTEGDPREIPSCLSPRAPRVSPTDGSWW